jgi:hypothetical protein
MNDLTCPAGRAQRATVQLNYSLTLAVPARRRPRAGAARGAGIRRGSRPETVGGRRGRPAGASGRPEAPGRRVSG